MKHYLPSDFFSQMLNIHLVGCGGTGSQILTGLARINHALCSLGHQGFTLTAYDPDRVSQSNIGRQNFSPVDVGQHKAVILVTRINQFYGLDWHAVPDFYQPQEHTQVDIIITAVDSASTRVKIGKSIKEKRYRYSYWLDTGNTKDTGQVVLGTVKEIPQYSDKEAVSTLPTVDELYDLKKVKEKDQGPSCSLAAALKEQDLMVNSIVSSWALQLLWQGLRYGFLENHGCFINLKTMRVNPLPIDPATWKRLKPF